MKCVNCGEGYRPTATKCEKYKANIELKKVMANESLNVEEAKERIRRESRSSKVDSGNDRRSSMYTGSNTNRASFASVVASKGVNNTSKDVISEMWDEKRLTDLIDKRIVASSTTRSCTGSWSGGVQQEKEKENNNNVENNIEKIIQKLKGVW